MNFEMHAIGQNKRVLPVFQSIDLISCHDGKELSRMLLQFMYRMEPYGSKLNNRSKLCPYWGNIFMHGGLATQPNLLSQLQGWKVMGIINMPQHVHSCTVL